MATIGEGLLHAGQAIRKGLEKRSERQRELVKRQKQLMAFDKMVSNLSEFVDPLKKTSLEEAVKGARELVGSGLIDAVSGITAVGKIDKLLNANKSKTTFRSRLSEIVSEDYLDEEKIRKLKEDFPDKLKAIDATIARFRLEKTPVTKSPLFKEGFGLPAKFSPYIAKMTPKAKMMISKIKTEADLQEFLDNVDEQVLLGTISENDKRTVLEYFGIPAIATKLR